MARGKRPVTFRTRKLSLSAPMVLPWRRGGRVGRRRTTIHERAPAAKAGALSHAHATMAGRRQGTFGTESPVRGAGRGAPAGREGRTKGWDLRPDRGQAVP